MGNVGSRLDDTGSLFFKDQSRCMFHVVLGLDLADVPGPGSFFRPLFPLPLAVVHLLCMSLDER